MRALPNERVFRYFEIESDHFCLRAFQNAGLEIGRVRIPWGLGVVSRLLKEPSFRSGDLFREPAVVFKRQDVVQGNRSIIMARWPSSGIPQWIMGAYSPVRNYFDEKDRLRLENYLNDKCNDRFIALNNQVIPEAIQKLHADFMALRDPLKWRSLGAITEQLDFLPIRAVEAFRTNPQLNDRDMVDISINPHTYRGEVLLRLENPEGIVERARDLLQSDVPAWHPLSGVFKDLRCTPVPVDDTRWLLVRHGPRAIPPKTLPLHATLSDQDERELQGACLGLRPYAESSPLLELAHDVEVHSLTLIEVNRRETELPRYPQFLCADGGNDGDEYEIVDPPLVVRMHLECYSDRSNNHKEWVSQLIGHGHREGATALDKAPPQQTETTPAFSITSGQYDVAIVLSEPSSLLEATQKELQQEISTHLKYVVEQTEKWHGDDLVNEALHFYRYAETADWRSPVNEALVRCWHHDVLTFGQPAFGRAEQWLAISDCPRDDVFTSIRALFLFHPAEFPVARSGAMGPSIRTPFDSHTYQHLALESNPACLSRTIASRVFSHFGMDVEIIPVPTSDICVPTQPGLPFFVSLRAFISYLQAQDSSKGRERCVLEKLEHEGAWLYVLTFERRIDPTQFGERLAVSEARRSDNEERSPQGEKEVAMKTAESTTGAQTHTVSAAVVSLQRCSAHGVFWLKTRTSEVLQIFGGLSMPVLNVHFWPAPAVSTPVDRPWLLRIVWRAPK